MKICPKSQEHLCKWTYLIESCQKLLATVSLGLIQLVETCCKDYICPSHIYGKIIMIQYMCFYGVYITDENSRLPLKDSTTCKYNSYFFEDFDFSINILVFKLTVPSQSMKRIVIEAKLSVVHGLLGESLRKLPLPCTGIPEEYFIQDFVMA